MRNKWWNMSYKTIAIIYAITAFLFLLTSAFQFMEDFWKGAFFLVVGLFHVSSALSNWHTHLRNKPVKYTAVSVDEYNE